MPRNPEIAQKNPAKLKCHKKLHAVKISCLKVTHCVKYVTIRIFYKLYFPV